jgi:hypothetical protein
MSYLSVLAHDDEVKAANAQRHISRQDAYFGDNHDFNQRVFDETLSYWPEHIIDVQSAALARQARVNTSKATNPKYSMSQLGEDFSYGETAAYLIVLGDKESGTVKRSWVEYMFGMLLVTWLF